LDRNPGEQKYIQTAPRKEIDNLDDLPFPDYEGFGFEKTMNVVPSQLGINEKNVSTFVASRSCPFQCTFCFHSSGNRYRQRSLDNVFAEIDYLVKRYQTKYLFISDELFSYNIERVREFCRRIKPYGIKWLAQFRVSDITKELVDLCKDGNCNIMSFGVESADNRILKSMKKSITIEQTEYALKLVYEAGMAIQGNFIFGDVEETLETAQKSLQWWQAHSYYGLGLNLITAYPGTALYKYAVRNGIIKDEVEFIKNGCPTVNLTKMTNAEMSWLTEQIAGLPLRSVAAPVNISNVQLNYLKATISLSGDCTVCHKSSHWTDVRLFTRNYLICEHCRQKHRIPILPEVTKRLQTGIKDLLRKYGKVAFWGMIDYFVEISALLEIIADKSIYFIDQASAKQGVSLSGKTINAPKVLDEQNIPLVVVPVITTFETIKTNIQNNFSGVKKTISILELLAERDLCKIL
jgi:uncharacterized radical SAM superfamily protein